MSFEHSSRKPESIQADGEALGSSLKAHLSRLNILVDDMGRSLSFYKLLGFSFKEENYQSGYVEERTPDGFRISWWLRGAMDGVVSDKATSGYCVELAFRCPGREGVDAVYQRIVDAGYTSVRPPFDSPWGQRYAFVEDPDGNLVGFEEHRTAE